MPNQIPKSNYLVERFYHRLAEGFYLVVKEVPNEFNNLAGKREYRSVQKELHAELLKWMEEQNDTRVLVDTKASFSKKYWEYYIIKPVGGVNYN